MKLYFVVCLLSQVRSTSREIQTEHSCREKIIAHAFRFVTYSNTRQPRENDIVESFLKYSRDDISLKLRFPPFDFKYISYRFIPFSRCEFLKFFHSCDRPTIFIANVTMTFRILSVCSPSSFFYLYVL